ncbi:hypothetical protein I317_01731 [Kwoniella heveanensis CBS 569]|uniref:Uncharacterized protein n=1 Tax=Kwoniella heveanensis BCC8398 TaxID=1296120 RepID=A0A1B9GSS7_9TREE|nr:hypothetical protein I316_04073 [Kwoniella heveanensis BCC8398]OCF44470.1 hypothetical protein I317_01731 [Kwoniella heveanensis CBS 569]
MGNRQSTSPTAAKAKGQLRNDSMPQHNPRKQKPLKKKDFKILGDHRPPGYTREYTDERSGLHSDLIRRQLDEMDARRVATVVRKKGDELPSYDGVQAK